MMVFAQVASALIDAAKLKQMAVVGMEYVTNEEIVFVRLDTSLRHVE